MSPAAIPRSGSFTFGVAPALALLCLALVFGGSSTGPPSTDVVRLAAAPVLALALWRLSREGVTAEARWPLAVFAAAVVLVVIQLVPLPPQMWSRLPGRTLALQGYAAAGMAPPWLPISLTPDATFDGLFGFLPPAAVFLSVLTLDGHRRRALLAVVLAAAVLAVGAGMLQMASGPAGPFRPYAITNVDSAVGFFANRNHQAIFLLCAVPITAYWAVRPTGGEWNRSAFVAGLAIALFTVLVVSLALTRSRAGMILLAPAMIGSAFVAARRRNGTVSWIPPAILAAAGLTGVVLVGLFAFAPIAARFHTDLDADMRAQLTPATIQLAQTYSPVGSGLGSFQPVYNVIERPPGMIADYVNHAHDDYLETWLELGWGGIGLMGAFVAWWAATIMAIGRKRAGDASMAMTGAVMVGLLLAHSFVDYPLRTPALACLFALGCGLMIAPGGSAPAAAPSGRRDLRAAPAV